MSLILAFLLAGLILINSEDFLQVLKWEDVEVGEPKEGEIRVKNKAIGLNFIDVYYRKGVYKSDLPFIPGGIIHCTTLMNN